MPLNITGPPYVRLRLLCPSIAVIVAATMIPTGLRHPSLTHIANAVALSDVLNNLILYLPLGFALAGSSMRRAFLFGLLLSTLAETLQLGYVDRIPSLVDIVCNTAGAVLGYALATHWRRTSGHNPALLKIPRMLAIAFLPIAVLGTILMLVHRPRPDFSNWSATAQLVTGDEVTGGRPWAGTISALQIYPFAMDASQITGLASKESFPDGGLIPAANPLPGSGQPLLSRDQERTLYSTLTQQNRMTLLVLAQPANVDQAGPARIVTYSEGPFDRNFTLGQVRTGLTFRLRTPGTGVNGTDPALYTGPVLTAGHPALLAAVYDGHVSSLYVDGKLAAHADLGLKRPHLPKRVLARLPGSLPIRVIELGAAEMLISSLLALGLFGVSGVSKSRIQRLLPGLAAGFAVGITIWAIGVSSRGLGGRIVLECVGAGLMIALSVQPDPA